MYKGRLWCAPAPWGSWIATLYPELQDTAFVDRLQFHHSVRVEHFKSKKSAEAFALRLGDVSRPAEGAVVAFAAMAREVRGEVAQ